ncbi:MAG TPA: Nramp family divalent metal transporter [Virgibacillus sp.]|nr:Nramp family divalent metal transporter [Virgibacillus sp.]
MEEKKGFFTKLKEVGPGAIVAAAIVGPGTITAASQAGAGFGMTLIWALVFSVIATMFLQEMSTRLGIITGKDLGTAFREQFSNPVLKFIAVTIVIAAIGVGNAAYETGNILGGASGLAIITDTPIRLWAVLLGLFIGLLLWFGNYKVIEKFFVIMVGIISLSFIITAVVIKPDIGAILSGIFVPKIPDGSIIFVISLIGTTIVPYTFFLQSATVQERWKGKEAVSEGRFDIIFSMIVVAIISVAIVVTAAGAFSLGTNIEDPSQMAIQLQPLLGSWAKVVFAIGIFGAGATSVMSASLAAAYAISGALGWKLDLKSYKFRAIWLIIILIGVIFSGLDYSPTEIIIFAQYANGLILPIIVLFMIVVMSNSKRLGAYVNKTWMNVVAWIIFIITLVLALQSFEVF